MKKAWTGLLSKIAAIVLVAALIFLGIRNQDSLKTFIPGTGINTISLNNSASADQINQLSNQSLLDKLLAGISNILFGIDLRKPENIISYHFPETTNNDDGDAEGDIIFDFNNDQLPPDIQMEVEKIQKEVAEAPAQTQAPQQQQGNKPSILIYHTHNDEAYLKDATEVYKETSAGRTLNQDFSVVKVGTILQQGLLNDGYTVFHDETDHVSGGLLTAYSRSLVTMLKYKDKCSVFIDLHRDAYINQDPNYFVANGVHTAKIMFVVGTGEGSTGKGYNPKPNWKENYKLALSITNKLNAMYPGICRPVYVRVERFNQHVSDSCLLAEIGNQKNSLAESEESAKILATAIGDVLSTK